MPSRRAKGMASLVALTAIWGTTFPAIKVAVEGVGFLYYVAFRFTLASAILAPLALKKFENLRKFIREGMLIGSLYFGGITLQGWGMEYTRASNAAFVTGLSVVFVYALETVLGKVKLSLRLTEALLLAVFGLYMLSFSEGIYELMLGDLIVLAGSLFWALQIISVDRVAKGDLYSLLFLECLVNALYASLLAFTLSALSVEKFSNTLIPLAYLATVCTIGANALQLYGQRWVNSIDAAMVYLLEPVFASVFSYIFLGEQLSPMQLLGASAILTSMAVSMTRHEGTHRV
ncbi:MAG: DMT family transporter [Thermofilaceae archaeon]